MKTFEHKHLKGNPLEDRDYQSNISEACLKQSTMVILPTGMGKTVIALRVILERLNVGPILLMAPTKPLAQQGPIPIANIIVPIPKVPPRTIPKVRTISSIPILTRPIGQPETRN